MKYSMILMLMIVAGSAEAGGTIGGVPPSIKDVDTLAVMRASLQQLPKGYADADDLRQASIRLGAKGIATTDLIVDGERIQVRKLSGSIVDEALSKEVLPR